MFDKTANTPPTYYDIKLFRKCLNISRNNQTYSGKKSQRDRNNIEHQTDSMMELNFCQVASTL